MRSERLNRLVPAVATTLAIAVTIAAAAGFVITRESLRNDDERIFETRAIALSNRVRVVLNDLVEAADRTGRLVGWASTRPEADMADLPVATGPLAALTGVERVDLVSTVVSPGGVALAAERSRDAAEPRFVEGRSGPGSILVVPTYAAADAGDDTPVATLRQLHSGYMLVQVDVDALVAGLLSGPVASALHLEVRQGDTVIGEGGKPDGPSKPSVVRTFDAAGAGWGTTVTPGAPFASGALLPWAVLLVGLVLAAGAGVTAFAVRRALGGARQEHEERARELELIADGGALLHQSLELADVLPAFSVRVGDALELDRLALLVLDDDGGLREVFALGGSGRWSNDTLPVGPTSAAAGEEFLLRLQRSGRNIGALRLRSRVPVDENRMRALAALGDLLAAALGNIQLYTEEQESVRRLQEVDRLKNDFVGTVSHELRTTVTAIAGFADLLVDQWAALPEDTRKDFLRRVSRNAGSLRLLVDDMLDVTRIDRLALSVIPERVDLSAVVTSVTEQMAAILEQHELVVAVPPGVHAWADARAVERILANLLSNAAKYSPAGGKVYVRLDTAGDRALLVVEDEGPGIPPEERGRIFARFYRGETEGARRTRGAGVGLAIVQELVERLEATVVVDDAPSGGARFTVAFPIDRPAAHLVETSQGDRHEPSS